MLASSAGSTGPVTAAVSALTGSPPYCSWFGVTCDISSNALVALNVEVNGLTGSIDHPSFMSSILQLHHCGLVNLSLHSNALSGRLTDNWAQMSHLEALDLSECSTLLAEPYLCQNSIYQQ
jgi:hypothetical protein